MKVPKLLGGGEGYRMTIKNVQEWSKLRSKLIVCEQRGGGAPDFQTFFTDDINELPLTILFFATEYNFFFFPVSLSADSSLFSLFFMLSNRDDHNIKKTRNKSENKSENTSHTFSFIWILKTRNKSIITKNEFQSLLHFDGTIKVYD